MGVALIVVLAAVVLVVIVAAVQSRGYRQAVHRERSTAFVDSRRSRVR